MYCLMRGHGVRGFMYQISSMQANDVDPEDLAAVFPVYQLCHAFALLLSQGLYNQCCVSLAREDMNTPRTGKNALGMQQGKADAHWEANLNAEQS